MYCNCKFIKPGGDSATKEWFSGLQPTPTQPIPNELLGCQEAPSAPLDLHAVTDSLHEQAKMQNLFDLRKAPMATDGLFVLKKYPLT